MMKAVILLCMLSLAFANAGNYCFEDVHVFFFTYYLFIYFFKYIKKNPGGIDRER